MIRVGPVPPSNDELCNAVDVSVANRSIVRQTNLSVVERIRWADDARPQQILKTNVPDLAHESHVHRIASSFQINAAKFQSDGVSNGYPWILIEDLGGNGESNEPSTHDIAEALAMLAEFHAATSLNNVDLSSIPDQSANWILDNQEEVIELTSEAFGQATSHDIQSGIERLPSALSQIADSLSELPLCIVHGDFDPGNLIQARGKWRTLDWGLAHRNVPLVDVAHMVMRFDQDVRRNLISTYADSASEHGLDLRKFGDPVELTQAADLAHKAYFVWWHSHCIVNLQSDPKPLLPVIAGRIRDIVRYE